MITLYTTHCPKCKVLTKKLDEKGIKYQEIEDVELMLSKNIMSVPCLEVENNLMDFTQAVSWVNMQ